MSTCRKQILNCAAAARHCRAEGVEWLLCNLDLDEAVCFSSARAEDHFGAVPKSVSQVVYINHEAVASSEANGATWFEDVGYFKLSPILKLPFMCRRFPASDEEPQLLDHPEGVGQKTLSLYQKHNARLAEQYNFKKRSGGSTCSCFDGYLRGKVAVRLDALDDAVPRVHRWISASLNSVVCHPGDACVLHYINCGGLAWFEAKYQIRGLEEANRLWFHVLAQERAKIGALKELYDDVLAVPDLQTQISEGFVVPLSLGCGLTPELATIHRGFWGWAAVSVGDALYVHMPLSHEEPELNLGEAVVYELALGDCLEVELSVDNAHVPVFMAEMPTERGSVLLDVRVAGDVFLCVAPEAKRSEIQSVSPCSPTGWRLRVSSHRWHHRSLAVWVARGLQSSARPHKAIEFQKLAASDATASRCWASVHFEHEMTRLPPELHFAYATFYAAYGKVDGQAIADEAKGDLELTYAEVEFVPFRQLLADVAKPQPGPLKSPFKVF